MSKLSPLKAKLALRAEKDAKIVEVLQKNKSREKAKFTGYSKRKGVSVLADYLSVSTDSQFVLRDPSEFVTRSYNLSKQIVEFVDHLFVKYTPPLFLYPSVLNKAGKRVVFDKKPKVGSDIEKLYRKWFLGIARGDSFAKMSGHELTKKEAHWFLQAPATESVVDNLTWSRARAAGMCAESKRSSCESTARSRCSGSATDYRKCCASTLNIGKRCATTKGTS